MRSAFHVARFVGQALQFSPLLAFVEEENEKFFETIVGFDVMNTNVYGFTGCCTRRLCLWTSSFALTLLSVFRILLIIISEY